MLQKPRVSTVALEETAFQVQFNGPFVSLHPHPMSEALHTSQSSSLSESVPVLRRQGSAVTSTSTLPDDDASPSLPSIRSEATTPRQGPKRPTRTPIDTIALPVPKQAQESEHISPTCPPNLKSLPFPTPKQPSKCPLFCCFYAEFDNKLGPKVSCQSPRNFMNQEIAVPVEKIHSILEETFERLKNEATTSIPTEQTSFSANGTPNADNRRRKTAEPPLTTTRESALHGSGELLQSSLSTMASAPDDDTDEPVKIPEGSLSIFDSCSEYIITGSELSDKIVNLSTHGIHILTRPTIIANEKYERNALLFCLGFVLRRTEDPRPFRPALAKLADTLREMEIESQFLSAQKHGNDALQRLLEWALVSLNSASWECNLHLNSANVLNLKLFHPPKRLAQPVADYAVPIFLRRDWQVMSYEWDLSINWVSLHIDGITNARQISKKAEVDMEMVQACLRVLRHHEVIALVDMFFYSNRYEATDKAASLLAGRENRLLHDAVEFVLKRPPTAPGGSESSPAMGSPSSHPPTRKHSAEGGKDSSPSQLNDMNPTASFRFASSSLFSHHETSSLPSHRRLEYHDVKTAVAEFYVACQRGISIGELWIALIGGNLPPGLPRIVNWRKVRSL